jgi:hypothetical protein
VYSLLLLSVLSNWNLAEVHRQNTPLPCKTPPWPPSPSTRSSGLVLPKPKYVHGPWWTREPLPSLNLAIPVAVWSEHVHPLVHPLGHRELIDSVSPRWNWWRGNGRGGSNCVPVAWELQPWCHLAGIGSPECGEGCSSSWTLLCESIERGCWRLALKCYESRARQHKMLNNNILRP